jgi:cytochrome c oxidase subunit 3
MSANSYRAFVDYHLTYLGNHTLAVQKGLNLGVILFIVSEGLFFVAIF